MRAGFTQLSFQLGDVSQQFALGVSPMRIFAQQGGQIVQAFQVMGGEGSKFLKFIGGPWGAAISAATVILIPLISKLFEGRDALSDLIKKKQEDARQTALSEQADRIWSQTLDGLIDRHKKLNEELSKRLTTQEAVDRDNLARQQADLDRETQQLAQERKRRDDLQKQLVEAQQNPGVVSGVAGAVVHGSNPAARAIEKQLAESEATINKLEADLVLLQQGITQSQVVIGQTQGKALADLAAKATLFGNSLANDIAKLQQDNPVWAAWATTLGEASSELAGAASTAASAGVDFAGVTNQASKFYDQLRKGQINAQQYAADLKNLAKQLRDMAEAAKEAAKQDPVKSFKSAVIGAEGTGPNKLGSSAAGFGQFMPSTWLSYFNRLFPDKAALDDAAKLAFRNVRSVAEAVIDKATDDYVKVLKAAGAKITEANLYTVHLLGASDAKKLLSASAGTQTSSFLSKAVLAGNPFLKGTAESARAAIAQRIGDSSGAVSSGAAAIQKALDALHEQEVQQQDNFNRQSAQLDAEIIRSRTQLLAGYDSQAKAEIDELEAEKQARLAAIQKQQNGNDITAVQADALRAQVEELTAAKEAVIRRREYLDDLRSLAEVQKQQRDFAIQDLQAADSQATTQAEHRRLQLQILDIQYKQKEEDLKRLLLTIQSNKDFATSADLQRQAMQVQAQLAHLPIERAQGTASVLQNTRGPLESYFSTVDTVDKFNEAVERLEVQGIDGLLDDITNLQDGFKSLTKSLLQTALQFVQGMAKLELQKGLSSLFGNSSQGITGAIGSLFGGGGSAGFGEGLEALNFGGGDAFGSISTSIPQFAKGGSGVFAGRPGIDRNILALNGIPIARVSYGERFNVTNDNSPTRVSGGNTFVQMDVYTPDGDSFRRSTGQIVRQTRRKLR
jgi:hypothetical protein